MKQFLQRYLPDCHQLRAHRNLRFLGDLLHDPRLWHFSRRSTVRGLTAGMFFAFVPVPWQMLLAASAAALLRFNLPVAVAMVWITNPLTIPPIMFACYQFGAWLLGRPSLDWAFEPTLDWFLHKVSDLGWPLLVGSMTTAVVASTLTFVIAHLLWRWHIVNKFRRRRRVVVCPG
ncbi:MAG TPA: DUF2062 domain-containing protein [Candidatus Competibacteraceae bacterium]|nr:DUF2062 domain-containing protein [Candidatus Competibacteraceae bacterium]HPF59660.1 DUF2062 domain-containing protein [Candidatus Competibacteraceae bacterium]HRY19261.1 DUF2062 domain-containing protein [Candidatus Competibacteraceae bacterium]